MKYFIVNFDRVKFSKGICLWGTSDDTNNNCSICYPYQLNSRGPSSIYSKERYVMFNFNIFELTSRQEKLPPLFNYHFNKGAASPSKFFVEAPVQTLDTPLPKCFCLHFKLSRIRLNGVSN
jgi:hypothetical protein